MRIRAGVVVSSLLVALFTSGLLSCGSDSGSPTKPDPDPDPGTDPDPPLSHNWTPGFLALPPADSAVFDSIAGRYRALRLSGDAESARASLLAALQAGWDGVAEAVLSLDSTAVQIVFTGGVGALLVDNDFFQFFAPGQSAGEERADAAAPSVGSEPSPVHRRSPSSPVLQGGQCSTAIVAGNTREQVVIPDGDLANPTHVQAFREAWEEHRENMGLPSEPSAFRYPRSGASEIFSELLLGQTDFASVQVFTGPIYADACQSIGAQAFAVSHTLVFGAGPLDESMGLQGHDLTHILGSSTRAAQYEQWQRDGKLIHGKAWSESSQSLVDRLYMREDLLGEELRTARNATIHFIAPRTGRKAFLERFLKPDGAASVMGWDGFVDAWDATASVHQLEENMAGRLDRPIPQSEALDLLHQQGLATLTDGDSESHLVVETASDAPLYPPSSIDFDAPSDCLEAGTVYYDVDVTYPDCPGMNQSFDFFPGGSHSLDGLFPFGAEINYQAKNADGKVVGSGIYDLDLVGGGNDVDLCPCWGQVDVDFSEVASFPGMDGAAQLRVDFDYSDPNMFGFSKTLDVSALGGKKGWEGMPGDATMTHTLLDGEGNVLGYGLEEDVGLRCDANAASGFCFGWLNFSAAGVPSKTSSVVVSGVSDNPAYDPSPVSFAPGGDVNMVGLGVGDRITGTAEARSATGELLEEVEIDQVIGCGENQVTVQFSDFGLVVQADKYKAAATGSDGAEIVFSVREWQDGDTDVPTGPPVAGVLVEFQTTMGEFFFDTENPLSENEGTTNEEGWTNDVLLSTEIGTATVTARIPAADLEAETIEIEFVRPLRMNLDNSPYPYDGWWLPPDSVKVIVEYCTVFQIHRNGKLIAADTTGAPKAHSNFHNGLVPGDVLEFTWKPGTDCPPQNHGFAGSYLSGAYIHLFYGTEYGTQINEFLVGEQNPLTGEVSVSKVLRDPASLQALSPFDLSAPERYVLSGFRERLR